jgi:hypothetical protein
MMVFSLSWHEKRNKEITQVANLIKETNKPKQ